MTLITRPCRDCGKPVTAKRAHALFCSAACRQAFNRRRRDRGAELYDFIMLDDMDTVENLSRAYKTADKALRDGRSSWQTAQEAVLNIPAAYGRDGDKR